MSDRPRPHPNPQVIFLAGFLCADRWQKSGLSPHAPNVEEGVPCAVCIVDAVVLQREIVKLPTRFADGVQ